MNRHSKNYRMRLGAMAGAWLEQQGITDLQALGFDERLAMLMDAECLAGCSLR